MRLALLAVMAGYAASAQPASTVQPPADDVTAYLEERRAAAKAKQDLAALAEESLKAGDYAGAAAAFRKLDDAGGEARVALAQNRTEEALRLLEAGLARSPGRSEWAEALVRLGRYDVAIEGYRKALETRGNAESRAQIYFAIGDLYRRQGDLHAAVAAFREAHGLAAANFQMALAMADALDAAGEKAEAGAAYAKTLEVDPHDSQALIARALFLLADRADAAGALRCARMAHEVAPDDPGVADILGQLYARVGDAGAALEVFRALIETAPRNPIYHYHLALVYLQQGDREESLSQLRTALGCNPPKSLKSEIEQGLDRLAKIGKQ